MKLRHALAFLMLGFLAVLSFSLAIPACSAPQAGSTATPVQTLSGCAKTEYETISKGQSILDIAESVAAAVASAILPASVGGGIAAAETAIGSLIAQYGEPILKCAVLKGAANGIQLPVTGDMAQAPQVDAAQVRFLIAAQRGWITVVNSAPPVAFPAGGK